METKKSRFSSNIVQRKKIETAFARLQSIKHKMSKLKLQLTTLKELQSERRKKTSLNNHRGKARRNGNDNRIKVVNKVSSLRRLGNMKTVRNKRRRL